MNRTTIPFCAAIAAAAALACASPAHAQGSPYNFPVGGSTQDLLRWQGSFNQWLAGMKDLSSLGLTYPGTGGLGTTGTILGEAQTRSRLIGKLTNLRTLGDPRAEAEVAAIVRRFQRQAGLDAAFVAERQVRNSVQQYELRTYYDKVASQARMDYYGSLAWARGYVERGDYDQALVWARMAEYFARQYHEYRR